MITLLKTRLKILKFNRILHQIQTKNVIIHQISENIHQLSDKAHYLRANYSNSAIFGLTKNDEKKRAAGTILLYILMSTGHCKPKCPASLWKSTQPQPLKPVQPRDLVLSLALSGCALFWNLRLDIRYARFQRPSLFATPGKLVTFPLLCHVKGKSFFASVIDGLLPITCTGSAGFSEHNTVILQLDYLTNQPLKFQAHPNAPSIFRLPAQRLMSVPQKIIILNFRYEHNNPCCAYFVFIIMQLPVHLSRNGIELPFNHVLDPNSFYSIAACLGICPWKFFALDPPISCKWFFTVFGVKAQVSCWRDYLKTRYSLLLTVHPNPGPRRRNAMGRTT